uniref:Uncharacterized protein n=1 Tax=Anguilla anguilla TaxID=7936 RepID=A0A0E9PRS7_ANGAN
MKTSSVKSYRFNGGYLSTLMLHESSFLFEIDLACLFSLFFPLALSTVCHGLRAPRP